MKEEPPLGAKCKDKFLIQSTLITPEKETLPLQDIVCSLSALTAILSNYPVSGVVRPQRTLFTRTKSGSHICRRKDRPSPKRRNPRLPQATQKETRVASP